MIKKLLVIICTLFFFGCENSTDENGFILEGDKKGYHIETMELYDELGFDKDGYNKDGFDRDGYNKLGWHKDGEKINKFTKTEYDENGFTNKGIDKNGNFNIEYAFENLDKLPVNDIKRDNYLNLSFSKEFEKDIKFLYFKRFDKPTDNHFVKGEFEKTKEFENRKKKVLEEFENELLTIANKVYFYEEETGMSYDADEECWKEELINSFYFMEEAEKDRSKYYSPKPYYYKISSRSKEHDNDFLYPMPLNEARTLKDLNIRIVRAFKIDVEGIEEKSSFIVLNNVLSIEYDIEIPVIILGYKICMGDKVLKTVIY